MFSPFSKWFCISGASFVVLLVLYAAIFMPKQAVSEDSVASVQPSAAAPSSPAAQPTAPRFQLSGLAYASPEAVGNVFGSPTAVTPIESDPAMMPGEFRDYTYGPDGKEVLVRFLRGEAVMIQIVTATRFDNPLDALRSMGINASSATPSEATQFGVHWSGDIGGVYYGQLSARSGSTDGSTGFGVVQVEFPER